MKRSEVTSSYEQKIRSLFAEFGIAPEYGRLRSLALQEEASDVVPGGRDSEGREKFIARETLLPLQLMQQAAANDGVVLTLESGFRSVDYQCDLIRKELAKGYTIDKVLTFLAAPGYSEHHTGRAVDFFPIKQEFKDTPAFQWLTKNAGRFEFSLSYPKDNPHGFIYEPWHWCFRR